MGCEFVGYTKDMSSNTRFNSTKTIHDKNDEWVNLKPSANIPAPSLKYISAKLDSEYKEMARYAYIDEKGELLFYMLRLVEKQRPSNKIFLPLSYGHWKKDSQNPKWWVKGYLARERKPLYNLMELTNNKSATVLIVEGEKTAEAAKKLFDIENIVCITWASGAGSILKSNWEPLFNRNVIIWPDNDQAGYKAAEELCTVLRRVGVNSLQVVDKNILIKELPESWDLADQLPAGKDKQFIRDVMLRAPEKIVNFDHLLLSIESRNKALTSIEKLQAKDVLCYVEGRLRPLLEQKEMNSMEINNEIISKAQKIYLNRNEIEKKLVENGIIGDLCKRLTYHSMIFQASKGKPIKQYTLEKIKLSIINFRKKQDLLFVEVSKQEIAHDYIQQAFEKKLSELFLSNKFYNKESIDAEFSAIKNDILEKASIISSNIDIQNTEKPILSKEKIHTMEPELV